MDYLHEVGAPIVVKADGLAAGKGVVVAEDMEEAEEARSRLLCGRLRRSGQRGGYRGNARRPRMQHCSRSFLKARLLPCPARKTTSAHSMATLGPNTGGMGVYSPVPCVTPELEAAMAKKSCRNAAAATAKEFDDAYTGVLYGGFMLTAEGPKLLEFNAALRPP